MNESPLFPDLQQENAAPSAPAVAAVAEPPPPTETAPTPDLFGEPAAQQTTPASAESGVVNAVVSQNDPEKGQILGPKPKTSAGLDVRSSHFNFGSFLFKFSIILGLLIFGFFYTQLSPTFEFLGKNPAQELAVYQSSFEAEQTSVNFYNLLMTKFALDDFTSAADSYLVKLSQYESDNTASSDLDSLEEGLTDLQDDMHAALGTAQEKLRQPIYPVELLSGGVSVIDLEATYTSLLKTKISEEKQDLRGLEDEESFQESNNLDGALALLNATALLREVKAVDLEEDLANETVESLFEQTTEISKDQTSTILAIRNGRVDWEVVLDEVESVTKKIDPLFGSGISSNIEYSNMSFSLTSGKASLRGDTRTDDTLNFSLISDLVDQLELSTYFSDVTTRSFSKSEGSEDDFSASFSLELILQEGEDERDAQATVVLEKEEAEEVEEVAIAPEKSFNTGSANVFNVLRDLFFGENEDEFKPVPRS
ncbi:hypothetical protein HN748_04320 [Candidatus Peregrinibacteria bacterium]|nr:hypothetical protein [Candidatus Peregrinibacteria bacterium]MBT7483840.1 hypothetical protein [Candidatus Peregrinibacteria bacterium]MBT7703435.1 hypothetical protein [Candidatus Peregrinibacteria bacterium]